MKKRRDKTSLRSQTLPASPSHSFSNSSSSEFEFTVSHSPRATTSSALCPADDLFYKGLLLPLHLSPRLSMVRTLLSASSSSATAARDSTGSSSTNDSHSSFSLVADCDSSRPSSVNEDDEFKSLNNHGNGNSLQTKKNKYFSLSRFSAVFKKENNANKMTTVSSSLSSSSVKKMSTTAKEVIRKYLKKVKPLYDKMGGFYGAKPDNRSEKINASKQSDCHGGISHSFSGNLRYPRRRRCVSSCPSSMRSSPTHSGVLSRNGFQTMGMNTGRIGSVGGGNIGMHYSDISSMEELQSAIQGAIAHCKNSLLQNRTTVASNEI